MRILITLALCLSVALSYFLLKPNGQELLPIPLSAEAESVICEDFYTAICEKRGETKDPTGAVVSDAEGEIQALHIYQTIIQENPRWTSDKVDEELVTQIYTPKRVKRVRSAYSWVRAAIERFIDQQEIHVFNEREKRRLKERLEKTRLQLPPPASTYSDEPDLFTKNDVFYERMTNGDLRLRVGGAYLLTAKSWFNLIFTLSHELAHSIDPCELRQIRLPIPAYDRLSACFMKNGLVDARKTRVECGENDQLSETFADWIAVYITAEALKQFGTEFHGTQLLSAAANSVRDLCEQDDTGGETDNELHPTPEIRIEKIFGQNPEVRMVLGCTKTTLEKRYCSFE